ncbi:MAG: SIR2 family protein [Saprospiraceae bacterium]
MTEYSTTNQIKWNNLVTAISNDECVLVLGPNIATIEREGQHISLQQLLAEHLAKELHRIQPNFLLLNSTNLAYVSKQLEDALLPECNFKEGRARAQLGELIEKFYSQYDISDFPVYEQLAKLPFRFIVNTCPDNFLLEALEDENKFDASNSFYHYKNPSHNNSIDSNKTEITTDAPLIFNLLGSVDDPDSMIITETDQLIFLDTVLQQENTAGIPNKIAIEFTSSREKDSEKNFIFLGFDFNQWHLRLILHLINRYQKQKETYVLQNPKDISDLTSFFYKRNFEIEFVDFLPEQFATTFLEKINTVQTAPKDTTRLNAFLMFDEKDEEIKNALDTHLSTLKGNEFIQTWDESKIAAGDERSNVVEEKLKQADIILILVTANLFNSDEIYEKQLKVALQCHEEKSAVMIPILMKSCMWQGSIIGNLSTILPRNRTPLDTQENENVALADIIQQLEGWCGKIYKRKKRRG